MKKSFKQQLDEMTHIDLRRWVGRIVVFAFVVLIAVFSAFILNFSSAGISNKTDAWGQFGDFIGGTANPIFGFLTLIALSLTIILQSKQLSISSREIELSRQELELTRNELSRSAQAQEMSEKALKAQAVASELSARLATINLLFDIYRKELDSMKGHSLSGPTLDRYHDLEIRLMRLTSKLDASFHDAVE